LDLAYGRGHAEKPEDDLGEWQEGRGTKGKSADADVNQADSNVPPGESVGQKTLELFF
jgi:hypothetical protein